MDPSGTSQSARITALEERQAQLERRIADLEQAAARQVPWNWPAQPHRPPDPIDRGFFVDPVPGQPGHISITCDVAPGSTTKGAATAVPPEQPKLAKHVYPPQLGDSVYGR